MKFLIVCPNGNWIFWQSYNRLGKPAQHLIDVNDASGKTLCRRNADNWQVQFQGDYVTEEWAKQWMQNGCKRCAGKLEALLALKTN